MAGKRGLGWLGAAFIALAVVLGGGQETLAASNTCAPENVRWSSSTNRIYVGGAGTVCTLSDLNELEPWANIKSVTEGTAKKGWLLGSNIVLEGGAKLNLYGVAVGGDVDELRLKSNNTGAADDIVYVRAQWGTIDIRETKITSWDEAAGGPDTEFGKYQRSYIQVKSYLDRGETPRQSRMDIINSEVGYLGYYGAEAYGLSWKVLGYDAGVFDKVDVFGDVRGSHIHHNFFGAYTYGAYGMEWRNNEIDNNVLYGLDPHDNSDGLVIEGNNVHHNGSHGIIASRYCEGLVIRGNESHDNGGNGIMLHRDTNDSVVENNVLYNNGDAALALFESHRNVLRGNQADNNGRGIRISVGSAGNLIENNTFNNNGSYGIFFYKGSDLPTAGDGRPKNNTVVNNVFNGSGLGGLLLKQGDKNLIKGNVFTSGGKDLVLVEARGNRLEGNTVTGNSDYGLRLKQQSADNEIVGNVVKNNGKVGIYVWDGSGGNKVNGNTIEGHSQYGVMLLNSAANEVKDNVIERNRRGTNLRDGSDSNAIERNTIRENAEYAVYIQNASGNEFVGNIVTGNGGNYYYTKSTSDNVIRDTPDAAVRMGDFASSMTLVDSENHVFKTVRRVPTVVALAQSFMKLTRYITGGVVDVTQADFVAVPSDNRVVVLLDGDYRPGELVRWVAKAEGATGVEYRIGGFERNEQYAVTKNGGYLLTAVADDGGKIGFSDSVAGGAEVEYRVERTQATFLPALSRPLPEPLVPASPAAEPTLTILASPSPDVSPLSMPTPSPTASPQLTPTPEVFPSPSPLPSPTAP